MDAWKIHDAKIRSIRQQAAATRLPLAMTECHFSIPGNNRHDLLRTATTLLEPEIAAATPGHRPIHVVVKPNWVQHRAESSDAWRRSSRRWA
jgi:hypothetical protein